MFSSSSTWSLYLFHKCSIFSENLSLWLYLWYKKKTKQQTTSNSFPWKSPWMAKKFHLPSQCCLCPAVPKPSTAATVDTVAVQCKCPPSSVQLPSVLDSRLPSPSQFQLQVSLGLSVNFGFLGRVDLSPPPVTTPGCKDIFRILKDFWELTACSLQTGLWGSPALWRVLWWEAHPDCSVKERKESRGLDH